MRTLLIVSFSLLFVACGKKDAKPQKKNIWINKNQIEYIMSNQLMDCAPLEEGGSCPGGIARLFMIDELNQNESGVCTGFMVNENTLVTNNHCVENQARCEDTYIAIYTGEGSDYIQTKCKNIVAKAYDGKGPNDPNKKQDYTVLEIEEVYTGPTLKVVPQAPEQGEVVSIWVVDHIGTDKDSEEANPFESRITELKCVVEHDSIWSSLTMSECPVIGGNSGSPIMNNDGFVIGVVWGSTNNKDSDQDLDSRRESSYYDFALGTLAKYFTRYL